MTINRAKRCSYRLLKRGSRFFKTDLFYLTKGGFWLGLGKGVFILSGFILSIGFANLLPKEVFGTYQFVLSLAGIVSGFTLTGLGITVMREAARGNDGALRAGVALKLKWSIGIALAALIGSLYYFLNDNNTLAISLLIVGAFSPFLESFRLYSAFLTGKKEFKKNTLYGAGRRSFSVIGLFGALLLTNDPVVLVLVYFATNTLTLVSLYMQLQKEYPTNVELDSSSVRFTKHLSLLNIISSVAGNIDKVLIFHFLGAAQLAIYAFATLPVRQLQSPGQIISTLSLPKMSSQSLSTLRRAVPAKAQLIFFVFLLITTLYIFAAPYLFAILFPQYQESVPFTQVLALGLLFVPLSLLKNTFIAHLRKREVYIMRITTPVVRIGLIVTLLPLYGLWGAVFATLGAGAINALLTLVLFFRIRTDTGM